LRSLYIDDDNMSDSSGDIPEGGRRRFQDCTEVSQFCPVEATVLGYYPNLGSGIFFSVAFGLVLIACTYLTVRKRTWSYGAYIIAGLILETAGYIGRILLWYNPWDSGAFQLQICAIIIGPTFICVSMYLTLKHVAIHLNPGLSRVRPRLYPLIFLPADLTCLIIQAIGGGIAAAAGTNRTLINGGNNAIIAGIALQVFVLFMFGITGADYLFRVSKYFKSPEADAAASALWHNGRFRKFLYGICGAYATIFVRCIYRFVKTPPFPLFLLFVGKSDLTPSDSIIEMAGGWGNHIMQDQPSFLVLDSTLMLIATFLLTAFHPGLFFPQMSKSYNASQGEKSAVETPVNEAGDSSNEGVRV
jgi:hypothetical protein